MKNWRSILIWLPFAAAMAFVVAYFVWEFSTRQPCLRLGAIGGMHDFQGYGTVIENNVQTFLDCEHVETAKALMVQFVAITVLFLGGIGTLIAERFLG